MFRVMFRYFLCASVSSIGELEWRPREGVEKLNEATVPLKMRSQLF